MKPVTDIPVEIKFKANLAKFKREIEKLNIDDLETRYLKIIAYLRYTEQDTDQSEKLQKPMTANGTLYKADDWELALKKYEIIETHLREKGYHSVIRKAFPDQEKQMELPKE